jgi:hypothetical protein
MHELYELRDKLCKELKKYGSKDLTKETLELVDKLSHATKNLDKIIEKYEEEENGSSYESYNSYGSYDGSYRNNRAGRVSYNNGSYARGRGRIAKRDSMGRYASDSGYSQHGNMVEELKEMMMDAPNEEIRREYEKIINRMESNM